MAQQQGQEPRKGGWAYSDAMIRVLEQYKQKFSWVWTAIERQESSSSASLSGGKSGPPQALTLEELFPGMDNDAAAAQVSALRKWLKSTPLSRRPLVKPTAKVAPESAVRMLQAALPPNIAKTLPPVELENVAPALLMSPLVKGGTASAFAGGNFELGDRVVTVSSSGAPAFGSRGTVVGVYDEAVEVLFDQEFLGGNDLFGRCNGDFGAMVPADQILNLSRPHAVKAEGAAAFKMVRKTGEESGSASNGVDGAKASVAAGGGAAPMSAAQALAAASAALQGKGAPKPPSGPEPRIPDKAGSKGFAWGTGRGVPVGIKAAASGAPKQAPAPPAPGSSSQANAGAQQLLAQLTKAASSAAAPGSGQQQQPMPPMGMPPPPPPHLMMMMPPPPPGGPPGSGPPLPYPPYPPHPGMIMHPHPPYPMPYPPPPHPGMMYGHGGPPPPPQSNNAGNELLAQLQRGGGGAGQQPVPSSPPPPNPGAALLSQLKGETPQSPPNPGMLLLQQLQNSPSAAGAAGAGASTGAGGKKKAPAPAKAAGGGDFEAMWQRMQKQADKVAPPPAPAAPAPPAAAEDNDDAGPPPPPAPSAAMLNGASGSSEADAFWDMMTNPAAAGGGAGGKKGGSKKK
jgi:hypothetical protein